MRFECPHCHNGIEIVIDSPSEVISCPECGSTFPFTDPEGTASFHESDAKILGRFRLIERLGSGHYGDVWKAYDQTLDREVALKVPRTMVNHPKAGAHAGRSVLRHSGRCAAPRT